MCFAFYRKSLRRAAFYNAPSIVNQLALDPPEKAVPYHKYW